MFTSTSTFHHEQESLAVEEKDGIRVPLLSQQHLQDREQSPVLAHVHAQDCHSEGDTPISTHANSNASANDAPTLPLPLRLLYVLYGLTLSLPMIPLMYILNTRIAMPLSLLSVYGALSFLPYSFKPLYAYGMSFVRRRTSLLVGWAMCGLTSIGWTWVSSTSGVMCLGVFSGIAMAWSGFVLGLTLLDTAAQPQHPTAVEVMEEGSQDNLQHQHHDTNDRFERAASVLQSQAATARNFGSLSGSLLTCLVFGISHPQQSTSWNETVIHGIFSVTAACHMFSFLLVVWSKELFGSLDDMTTNTLVLDEEPEIAQPAAVQAQHNDGDEASPRPSIAGWDVYQINHESFSGDPDHRKKATQPFCTLNVLAVVILQASILVLALKGPILLAVAGHALVFYAFAFGAPLLVLTVLIIGSCIGGFRQSFSLSNMVGLVLILRHAVPSSNAVLKSFLYHCFQSHPAWLQVFMLADNAMVTLASWSYQKIWASRYSHGRRLLVFMMITTVVAYSVNNLFAVVIRYSSKQTMDDSVSVPAIFPWLVLVIKAVNAFVAEWNFLPSVVLATVSLSEPTSIMKVTPLESQTPHHTTTTNSLAARQDEEGQQMSATEQGLPRYKLVEPGTRSSKDVTYGSLISCIDFGDQIGAILSTPIVTALGITRENNWKNLDHMILICSGLGILSATILVLLFRWIPSKASKASNSGANL